MNEDVTFVSDAHRRPQRTLGLRGRTTHLSWSTGWGRLTLVDLDSGRVHEAKGSSTSGDLFDGLTSFAVADASGRTNVGLSPHVTADGFCDDGCFRLGHQDVKSGAFTGLPALPFRATQTSVSYHDLSRGVYYAQGSYPLTKDARCDADDTTSCLFAINSTSGALLSSHPLPTFQVYRYADQPVSADGTVLAWGFGFQDVCNRTLDSYAFARVHLASATATRVACIDEEKATIHKSPEMGAFSSDASRFAFATGDSVETGLRQLIVFDTATGAVLLNSKLDGLPKALGVSPIAPFFAIWGLAHMPAEGEE